MGALIFCEICNALMKVQGDNGKFICSCVCGHVKEIDSLVFSEKGVKTKEVGKGVAKYEKSDKGFPHTCLKCGHESCEIIDLGFFQGDESNIYLYTCLKCGFTERQADGTGNS